MSPERMDHLLSMVGPLISKRDTNFRKAIPAQERLMLTLRFLASGDSQISLTYLFRMGKKTVSRIIGETCIAIHSVLVGKYFNVPESPEQWRKIANDFEELWNFPHVIGDIDGKHVRIQAPNKSGSLCHNYKDFFSTVILAVCDAKYNFIYADIGQYGSNNDCGVLANSGLAFALEENKWNVPEPERIDGIEEELIPYYLLGDEIFPLKQWLMRPYPGTLREDVQIYNYCHSRSRLPIENSFGILVARFRIFHRPIIASEKNVRHYIFACMCLHNYLRQTENSLYCPVGFVDISNRSGEIKEGEWRKLDITRGLLEPLKKAKGSRRNIYAKNTRDLLKEYFNKTNVLSWQLAHVQSTGRAAPDNA